MVSALAFSGMFSLNAAKALSSMAMMQSKAWIVMRLRLACLEPKKGRKSPVQGSST
jgi:hypothetical protein